MQTPLEVAVDSFDNYSADIRPFGAYLLITAVGKAGSCTRVMRAIVGREPTETLDNAMVVTDGQFPLTVAGHTRIEGNILSGPMEITTGRIDARTTSLDSAFVGKHIIDPAASYVPCSTVFISEYLQYVGQRIDKGGYRLDASLVLQKDDGQFLDDHPIIHVNGNLEISDLTYSAADSMITIIVDGSVVIQGNTRLEGSIEIISKRTVVFKDSAFVSGGVYYAEDSVLISGNCRFGAQVITVGRLRVSDYSVVFYPSALISLAGAAPPEDSAAITLASRRPISSVCLLLSDDSLVNRPQGKIFVDTGVVFTGTLSSEGFIDLRGTIHGSVVASNFWHFVYPTEYINWLVDARISRTKLGFKPAMPIGFGKNRRLRPFMIACP